MFHPFSNIRARVRTCTVRVAGSNREFSLRISQNSADHLESRSFFTLFLLISREIYRINSMRTRYHCSALLGAQLWGNRSNVALSDRIRAAAAGNGTIVSLQNTTFGECHGAPAVSPRWPEGLEQQAGRVATMIALLASEVVSQLYGVVWHHCTTINTTLSERLRAYSVCTLVHNDLPCAHLHRCNRCYPYVVRSSKAQLCF